MKYLVLVGVLWVTSERSSSNWQIPKGSGMVHGPHESWNRCGFSFAGSSGSENARETCPYLFAADFILGNVFSSDAKVSHSSTS
jgi:hypothetical protein